MSHLIFDAQVFQTPAWHRGMGKYSLELIRSMVKGNKKSQAWDNITIVLSDKLAIDDKLFADLESLPKVTVVRLDMVANDILNPTESAAYNRQSIDHFIAEQDDSDMSFLILSLMQGEISPVFPSDGKVRKSVLFYDLIPLMMHKTYLQNPITRKEYMSKLAELIKADSFLAISKTVANDLSVYLGIDTKRIININGGPIEHDTKQQPMRVDKPYILMPTGNDLRKNNRRAIEAFNIFNSKHKNRYHLVITSFFKDEQIKELSQLSSHVIFTGNISGAELNYLFEQSDLVLFPSEYEGLGMPVLEALEHAKPVACSDIAVFREISSSAFSFFNEKDIHSIASGIERALKSSVDTKIAGEILDKYSWSRTAEVAEITMKRPVELIESTGDNVVIVGPDPSDCGLAGKFMLQLHAELSCRLRASYYQEEKALPEEPRINFLPYISDYQRIAHGNAIFQDTEALNIYHITNAVVSHHVILGALARPGIVLLYDFDMQPTWDGLLEAGLISQSRYDLELSIDAQYTVDGLLMLGSLLANQRKIIVFSKVAQKKVQALMSAMGRNQDAVYYRALPVNGLVYPEVAPTDKEAGVALKNILDLEDMPYERRLSGVEGIEANTKRLDIDNLLPRVEIKKYQLKTRADAIGYGQFAEDLAVTIADTIKETI